MRKLLIIPLFLVSSSASAAIYYWVLGSIAVHLAALLIIQFDSATNQPTNKSISVLLNKNNPDERNLTTPSGWTDPNTPPQTKDPTIVELWEGGTGASGSSSQEACDSAATIASATYSNTYTGTITTCWNGGTSCSCRLTDEDDVFFQDVTVAVTSTTTDCGPGYNYDGTTCQLTDATIAEWPTDDIAIVEISPTGDYECNSHDADCDIPTLAQDGVTINGDTITTDSGTQTTTVVNNGAGNGTTVTIQNTDGNGNGTSWTQHHYDDNGDLVSTQTGIGDAPGTPNGNGQTTGIGDCGGPNQVPCDVSLSTEGMPANVTNNEYDTIVDSVYQPVIDEIGNINIDHKPLIGDWNFLNAFPSLSACGDLTLNIFGHNITFEYSKLNYLKQILAWFFYILTAITIFHIAVSSKET